MSLLQFIINLLAGFIEKDIVVGGKKSYLFEYDYSLDDGTLVSVKSNGNDIFGALEGRPPSTRIGMLGARGFPVPPIDNEGHNYGL